MTLRLLLSYGALAAVCLALAGAPLFLMQRRDYVSRAAAQFNAEIQRLRPQLREAAGNNDRAAFDRICGILSDRFDGRVILLDGSGNVLGDSIAARCMARARPECLPAAHGAGKCEPVRDTVTVQIPFILGPKGRLTARLILPLAPIHRELATIRRLLAAAGIAAALLALFTGIVTARRITRPVEEMTVLAERIAAGDFGHVLSVSRKDEIGRLAGALDGMRRNLSRTLRELRRERNQALAIVRSLNEGVIALDAGGRVLFVNPAAVELAPWARPADDDGAARPPRQPDRTEDESSPGAHGDLRAPRSWPEAVRHAVHEVLNGAEARVLETGDPRRGERTLRIEVQPVAVHAGVVVVLQDVTEMRRTERMARDLVANASHELRTPTAVIASTAETLLEELDRPETADLREFAGIILRQARRMEELVNETLQLSRLEMADVDAGMEDTPWSEIVTQAVAAIRPLARERNISLDVPPPPSTAVLRCAPRFVVQAVRNLLDNAVRYSPPGSDVRLIVRRTDDGRFWECIVDDSGPGVPESERKALLDPFVRGGVGERTNPAGAGLGLAIVARVANLYGGAVSISESPLGGARFVLRLPAAVES